MLSQLQFYLPSLVHHGRLVESLLLENFDGLLTGDSGQDGERG